VKKGSIIRKGWKRNGKGKEIIGRGDGQGREPASRRFAEKKEDTVFLGKKETLHDAKNQCGGEKGN